MKPPTSAPPAIRPTVNVSHTMINRDPRFAPRMFEEPALPRSSSSIVDAHFDQELSAVRLKFENAELVRHARNKLADTLAESCLFLLKMPRSW